MLKKNYFLSKRHQEVRAYRLSHQWPWRLEIFQMEPFEVERGRQTLDAVGASLIGPAADLNNRAQCPPRRGNACEGSPPSPLRA